MNNPLRNFCDAHQERTDIYFQVPTIYMNPDVYTGYLESLYEVYQLKEAVYDEETCETMMTETDVDNEFNYPPLIALISTPSAYLIFIDQWGKWQKHSFDAADESIPIIMYNWLNGDRTVFIETTNYLVPQILRNALALSDYNNPHASTRIPFFESHKLRLTDNKDGIGMSSFVFPIGMSWVDVYTVDSEVLLNVISGEYSNFRALFDSDDFRLDRLILEAVSPATDDVRWREVEVVDGDITNTESDDML